MRTYTNAFRLHPGQDLKKEIELFAQQHHLISGWLVSCIGSLTSYHIRFANQSQGSSATGHFEILSLHGTVSTNGLHLHIAISDPTGNVIGGHLLDGNIIFTTAEIVMGSSEEMEFHREKDPATGYAELAVKRLTR